MVINSRLPGSLHIRLLSLQVNFLKDTSRYNEDILTVKKMLPVGWISINARFEAEVCFLAPEKPKQCSHGAIMILDEHVSINPSTSSNLNVEIIRTYSMWIKSTYGAEHSVNAMADLWVPSQRRTTAPADDVFPSSCKSILIKKWGDGKPKLPGLWCDPLKA